MLKELLKPDIQELIHARNWLALKEVLSSWSSPEIADLLLDLEHYERVLLFRSLERNLSSELFAYMETTDQDALLEVLTNQETRDLLSALSPDDRTTLLEELPAEMTQRLLSLLSPEDLKEARFLLGYPEQSVGRLMTVNFVSVRAEWTVAEGLAYIRANGQKSESINRIYITDSRGCLQDDVPLRSFIFADPDMKISALMDQTVVSLSAFEDQEEAVKVMEKYDISELPVIDSAGVLIGIVTFDDVMDIQEEEATEDFQKFGGMQALEKPYEATLTATALGYFENELEKAVILSMFLPLIISSGGNSGSQAATLIVRALSINEINLKDWWFVLQREFLSGLLLGLVLGIIGFFRIVLWSMATGIYGDNAIGIGLTVGVSLVGVVMWGTLSGSMLPLLMKRLGFDPATSSAPFVATLVDVTGIIIYFSAAVWFLRGTLL